MSAKRSASHVLARYPAASDAACAAVVPAAKGGDEDRAARAPADGRCEARPPLGQSTCGLAREPPADATERVTKATSNAQTAAARPTCTSTSDQGRCVRYCTSPSAICASSTREARPAPSANSRGQRSPLRGEVAEHEDERDREDRDGRGMDVDQRLQPPEPVDVLRAAAGVRPAGRRERPGQEQHAGRRGQRERAAPELERRDRLARGRSAAPAPRARARPRRPAAPSRAAGARPRPASAGRCARRGSRAAPARACRRRSRAPAAARPAAGRARRTTRPRSAARARSRRRRARGSRTR